MAAHAGELEARPQMLLGVVDAKADQLRQGAAQLGDERQPLPFGVGPEDGHGSQLGIAGPQAGCGVRERSLDQPQSRPAKAVWGD